MKKNNKTIYPVIGIIIGMFLLSFAFVPLYDLFCKVTGYGGRVTVSEILPDNLGSKKFKVFFNADVNQGLEWYFRPQQRLVETLPGKRNLIFYEAQNKSQESIKGVATYNITPLKAGKYFSKIECFCFEEQILAPNEKIIFPVSFYIDPEIENNPYLSDIEEITLSYSFFKTLDNK